MQLVTLLTGKPTLIAAAGTSEWWDKEWTSGLNKKPAAGSLWLGYEGLSGDGVADTKAHGGVDRAVCVYPAEHYAHWHTLPELAALAHGALGENFTTQGLLENEVCIGDIYKVGAARVQVSQPRQPCWKPARQWRLKEFTALIEQTGFTGFYFRVLKHGEVCAGDALTLESRLHPTFTITHCNEVYYRRKQDAAAARELAECPELSGGWKDMLYARARALTTA
ncbi:MAG TPA: MOSC domain-containing protein [Rariglobus sp.]|jgi:MOSC domain-containing protein YiiM|nr:MOSC domain-containing protein [Rariglobus sp.]